MENRNLEQRFDREGGININNADALIIAASFGDVSIGDVNVQNYHVDKRSQHIMIGGVPAKREEAEETGRRFQDIVKGLAEENLSPENLSQAQKLVKVLREQLKAKTVNPNRLKSVVTRLARISARMSMLLVGFLADPIIEQVFIRGGLSRFWNIFMSQNNGFAAL